MLTLTQLPDDVLIPIIQYCRVDDVLSLRLTSHAIRSVISNYINTLAPAVASQTFPNASLLLRAPANGEYSLAWLKGLLPKQLASIAVDKYDFPDLHGVLNGIPANEECGDPLRERAVNGLRIWKQLSNISKEVHAMPEEIVPSTSSQKMGLLDTLLGRKQQLSGGLRRAEKYEKLIWQRRLKFVECLSKTDVSDYALSLALFLRAFVWQPIPTKAQGRHSRSASLFDLGERDGITTRQLWNGNSWINWWLLHEGPEIFRRQWCNSHGLGYAERNHVRNCLWQMWLERDRNQIAVERQFASDLDGAIRFHGSAMHSEQRSKKRARLLSYVNAEPGAYVWDCHHNRFLPRRSPWEIHYRNSAASRGSSPTRWLVEVAGFLEPVDPMSRVPYFIYMRC